MIKILTTKVTAEMSLEEARALYRYLVEASLTEREQNIVDDICAELDKFLNTCTKESA